MTVYRIARWSEIFETAESRRHLTLSWISIPIGFGSTGYQLLLDEFGDDAAAFYGCWVALTQIAATCPARGLLCSSKGQPFKTAHMARLSGFRQDYFERLIEWASSAEVGWLEEIDPEAAYGLVFDALETKNPGKTKPQAPPRPAPAIAQAPPRPDTSLPNPTQPNPTLPNLTQPNPTTPNQQEPGQASPSPAEPGEGGGEPGVVVVGIFSGMDLETTRNEARKLQKQCPSLEPAFIWQSACLAWYLSPGLLGDVVSGLRNGDIKKAKQYIAAALRKAADEQRENLAELKKIVPPLPADVENVPVADLRIAKGTVPG